MARLLSAGMIKGISQAHGKIPAEGTKLRLIYDLLYEHRGRRMPPSEYKALTQICREGASRRNPPTPSSQFHVLRDQYGCDIRGGVLIGEWFGRIYIDYTAPAEDQAAALSFETAPSEQIAAARDALLGSRPGESRVAQPTQAGTSPIL